MGDTIFASREGTSPGPEHREWLPLPPAAPTSHLSVGWGHLGSLTLHSSFIPLEEILASTFWAAGDIHLWQNSKHGLRWMGATCVLCFHQIVWIPQH